MIIYWLFSILVLLLFFFYLQYTLHLCVLRFMGGTKKFGNTEQAQDTLDAAQNDAEQLVIDRLRRAASQPQGLGPCYQTVVELQHANLSMCCKRGWYILVSCQHFFAYVSQFKIFNPKPAQQGLPVGPQNPSESHSALKQARANLTCIV